MGGSVEAMTIPFDSYYQLYSVLFAVINAQEGTPFQIASRLLPRSLAETDPGKAAQILLSLGSVGIR